MAGRGEWARECSSYWEEKSEQVLHESVHDGLSRSPLTPFRPSVAYICPPAHECMSASAKRLQKVNFGREYFIGLEGPNLERRPASSFRSNPDPRPEPLPPHRPPRPLRLSTLHCQFMSHMVRRGR